MKAKSLSSQSNSDVVSSRAAALDTNAAVLPMGRRDQLAELLIDQDVETLRRLVNEGMARTR